MANGKIPNFNNKFYGDKLVEVTFPDSTGSLGFDEYNAVLNNANSSITSSKIMNADYALNARIPTNNDRLISGTAQRMEIQDSNYSSVAWTSPRYVGSQTISARYNDYTPSGSSVTFADGTVGTWKGDQVFNEYPGDETFTRGNPLGKVPAVDLYSTHFVLFDRIEIDSAIFDRDVFHCLYLIDDQGNKVPLSYKNKNLVDLRRLYVQGSNAEVVFLGQNNQDLLDDYPINRVGIIARQDAVITNDMYVLDGSGSNASPSSLFTAANSPQGNYPQGSGCAATQFVFTYNALGKFGENNDAYKCMMGIHFSPSLFSASLEGGDIYKLTYSISGSGLDRVHYIDEGFFYGVEHSFKINNCGRDDFNNLGQTVALTSRDYGNGFIAGTDYLGIGYELLATTDEKAGKYINNPNAYTPISYSLNENKLDPFYMFTYNSQNNKVFEGTIYETIINNAGFQSGNPVLYDTFDIGGLWFPQFVWNTNNLNINGYPMEPQSKLSDVSIPIKIGDNINFQNFPLNTTIPYNLLNPAGSDTSQLISEYYNPTIFAETKITEIGLGEIDESRLYQNNSSLTIPLSNPSGSYRLTRVSDYADSNFHLQQDIYIEDSLYEGDMLAVIHEYPGNNPSSTFSTINPGSFPPSNLHMLYLNPSSSINWGNASGNNGPSPSSNYRNQDDFLKTLSHGDIIELTQWNDWNNGGNTLNHPGYYNNNPNGLPDDKIWRYLILKAPDYYDGNSVGNINFPRPFYRFIVQYINGHNGDNLVHGGGTSNLSSVSGYGNPNTSSDPRIVIHRITRMKEPYIKVKQLSGSPLADISGSIINNPDTIMGFSTIKEHEQYIESQFLTGTGVGVLIPDNYDPKLREQLPDIINKTGIDINSLVQGNN
jgi:hypothetical protein